MQSCKLRYPFLQLYHHNTVHDAIMQSILVTKKQNRIPQLQYFKISTSFFIFSTRIKPNLQLKTYTENSVNREEKLRKFLRHYTD